MSTRALKNQRNAKHLVVRVWVNPPFWKTAKVLSRQSCYIKDVLNEAKNDSPVSKRRFERSEKRHSCSSSSKVKIHEQNEYSTLNQKN